MNSTGPYCWKVNIGSGNGLVPSGNKPLPEPMLTQFLVALWTQWVNVPSLGILYPFEYKSFVGRRIFDDDNTKAISLGLNIWIPVRENKLVNSTKCDLYSGITGMLPFRRWLVSWQQELRMTDNWRLKLARPGIQVDYSGYGRGLD